MLYAVVAIALQAAPGVASYEVEVSPDVQAAMAERRASPSELIEALTEFAEAGDDSAAELLGEIHGGGLFGAPVDHLAACDWFERIARKRPDAAHNYATCFFSGQGRDEDMGRARALYAIAADGGWLMANCALGNMMIRGQGGDRDVKGGLARCRYAAERGSADAQTDLGTYLLMGEVVDRDVAAATDWLRKAAAQEQRNALFLLGQIYWKGDGVPEDRAEAARLWRRSFEAGRTDAAWWVVQRLLGEAVSGDEGDRRLDRSYLPSLLEWAELAIEKDPDAITRIKARKLRDSLAALAAESANRP